MSEPTPEELEAIHKKLVRRITDLKLLERARTIPDDPTFYVEARVGSENYRGDCCRAVWKGAYNNEAADQLIPALAREVVRLQAFKDWVHKYLDDHGVPEAPPGTHGEHGCRIGDRMDWLLAEWEKERERADAAEALLGKAEQLPRIEDMAKFSREGLENVIRTLESRWNRNMVLWAEMLGCEPNGPSLDIAVAKLMLDREDIASLTARLDAATKGRDKLKESCLRLCECGAAQTEHERLKNIGMFEENGQFKYLCQNCWAKANESTPERTILVPKHSSNN